MQAKLKKIQDLEAEISRMVDGLKTDLVDAVSKQQFDGKIVNDGSTGGPVIGIVTLGTVMNSRGMNLTPEYYLPPKQVEAVKRKLNSATTVQQVCSSVKSMLEDKVVRFSKKAGDCIYLNDNTLRIISESELGQYVMSNAYSATTT